MNILITETGKAPSLLQRENLGDSVECQRTQQPYSERIIKLTPQVNKELNPHKEKKSKFNILQVRLGQSQAVNKIKEDGTYMA